MYRCTELKWLCTIKNISLFADLSRIIIENGRFGKEKKGRNYVFNIFLTEYINVFWASGRFCAKWPEQ